MASLTFTTIELPVAELGPEAGVPAAARAPDGQNRRRFELPEGDPVASRYGQLPNAYPYRSYLEYARELRVREVPAAVLENGFLRAVFLPDQGGRLWSLTDVVTGRPVVYENDVLRASNLAVRDAWFSGGVEWNIGVIGHTPLTMDALFAGELAGPNGEPVLRLWGYERIRGVVYSLDFWLAEDRPALCAAVTVRNPQTETVPMYWWTNIAMPLAAGNRVFTPATRAYTDIADAVTLVDVPEVEGVDVSWPARVPRARDFFFVLADAAPRFLAAVGGDGRGLLHSSSARLVSRKLFVWGDSPRGRWWQSFLTERAGPYYEVQAGLAPTQYACIPMPPGAEWSWVERFEPLALDCAAAAGEFAEVSDRIARDPRLADFTGDEAFASGLRRVPATVVRRGNGDAQLEDELRARQGLPPLAPELDFASDDPRTGRWSEFLGTGRLAPPPPGAPPPYDVAGPGWAALLREAAAGPERADGNVQYHLGLVELDLGDVDAARDALLRSLELGETPWARYALAAVDARAGRVADAVGSARRALAARPGDLSLAKSALRILRDAGAWAELLAAAAELAPELQHEGRIRFLRAAALHGLGRDAEARGILEADGGLELADLREGDDTLTELAEAVGAASGKPVGPRPPE